MKLKTYSVVEVSALLHLASSSRYCPLVCSRTPPPSPPCTAHRTASCGMGAQSRRTLWRAKPKHQIQISFSPNYREIIAVSRFILASQIIQWNLVITRSLGPWKLPCCIKFLIISGLKKQRNIKRWDQQKYLVIRGFCYIWPLYNEVPLYHKFSSYLHPKPRFNFLWDILYK